MIRKIIMCATVVAVCLSASALSPEQARPGCDLDAFRRHAAELSSGELNAYAEALAIYPLDSLTLSRIKGLSLPDGAKVEASDLRYLIVPHHDGHGNVCLGEIIVNRHVAEKVAAVFGELFKLQYPIERMELIDNYKADDEASMTANNTSGFCYRVVAGSNTLSTHARGVAVDINPLYNPYVKKRDGKVIVQPKAAEAYIDRSKRHSLYQISGADDPAVRIFKRYGFDWGGDWQTLKDYQHFEYHEVR